MNQQYSQGYTLVELMITAAVIGMLAAIAIPAYEGYIETSKEGTVRANGNQLIPFQETYFYENDTYLEGTYDPSSGTDDLTAKLGWKPTGDKGMYVYVVEPGTCGNINSCYRLTVSHKDDPSIKAVFDRP